MREDQHAVTHIASGERSGSEKTNGIRTRSPEETEAIRQRYLEKLREELANEKLAKAKPEEELQLRDNAQKPQVSYVLTFPNALVTLARVLEYGAGKYAPYNYKKGAPFSQCIDCLMRHLTAWHNGEDNDPESGQSHLGHVLFNALQLAEMEALARNGRKGLDDRPHTFREKPNGEA